MDPKEAPDGVALISASHPTSTAKKPKRKPAKKKSAAKRKPAKKKKPTKKAAKRKSPSKPKKVAKRKPAKKAAKRKNLKTGAVRTARLDMRLSKEDKRMLTAKSKKTGLPITELVLKAVASIR